MMEYEHHKKHSALPINSPNAFVYIVSMSFIQQVRRSYIIVIVSRCNRQFSIEEQIQNRRL